MCQRGEGPCAHHLCRRCEGGGLVCPACRGDRFVIRRPWDIGIYSVELMRCETCCEGNQVSVIRERRAIDRYLMRFAPQTAEQQREARHARHAAEAEAAKAYRAQWLERTQAIYGTRKGSTRGEEFEQTMADLKAKYGDPFTPEQMLGNRPPRRHKTVEEARHETQAQEYRDDA